jgi:hypothetical protein
VIFYEIHVLKGRSGSESERIRGGRNHNRQRVYYRSYVAPFGLGDAEIGGAVSEVTELGAFAPNFSSVSVPDSSGESSGCVGR